MKTTKLLLLAAITAWIVVIGAVMTSCSSDDDTPIGSTIIENENGKEELDLNGELMVYAQTGYIYDAKVLGCKNKSDILKLINSYKSEGWEIIDKDLNAKAAGKYIYLAVKTCNLNSAEQGEAISDFYLSDHKDNVLSKDDVIYKKVSFDGDSDFDGNLNAGAGGSTFYLFYTSHIFENQCAVTKVTMNNEINDGLGLNGKTSGDPQNAQFKGYDLNTKTKKNGEKIYMHIETSEKVARWCAQDYDRAGYIIHDIIGDTKGIKTVSIPLKFNGKDVREAYNDFNYGDLPDLEVQNYYAFTLITHASALTQNNEFRQVNVLNMEGDVRLYNTLPESITDIHSYGFRGTSIEEIALPYGLKQIGKDAFMDCTSLKAIIFGSTNNLRTVNEQKWNEVIKDNDWNKNVHSDFKVYFKGIE